MEKLEVFRKFDQESLYCQYHMKKDCFLAIIKMALKSVRFRRDTSTKTKSNLIHQARGFE